MTWNPDVWDIDVWDPDVWDFGDVSSGTSPSAAIGAVSSLNANRQQQLSTDARVSVLQQPTRVERSPLPTQQPLLDVTEVVLTPPVPELALPPVTAVVPNTLDAPLPFPPVEAFSEFQGQQAQQAPALPSRAQEAQAFYGSILGEVGVTAEPNMVNIINEVAVDPANLAWDPVSHSEWVGDWQSALIGLRGN